MVEAYRLQIVKGWWLDYSEKDFLTDKDFLSAHFKYSMENLTINYFSSLQVLERLGFEIPETEFTNYTSDVEQYRAFWKEGNLFTNYPTDGIVLTFNSRKLQKQLDNKYSSCLSGSTQLRIKAALFPRKAKKTF